MNAKTLIALKGSIGKWEGIVAGTEKDHGRLNCPLCQVFFDVGNMPFCCGCPVFNFTGYEGCHKTPYVKWGDHYEKVHNKESCESGTVICKICERHAQAEVDFLKSLLPEVKP